LNPVSSFVPHAYADFPKGQIGNLQGLQFWHSPSWHSFARSSCPAFTCNKPWQNQVKPVVHADKKTGTRLTDEGRKLLEKYRQLKKHCIQADDTIFDDILLD